MLIDELLLGFDVHEVHQAHLPARPAEVLAAARAVTPREMRMMRVLMGLRALPSALTPERLTISPDVPFLEQALAMGFLQLAEHPDELVIGGVGKFWSLAGNRPVRMNSREDFLAFEEPGFAKVAMNLAVRPDGSGTRISTETRIAATDAEARRRFRVYWLLIGPWSALIRRELLNAVRTRLPRQ